MDHGRIGRCESCMHWEASLDKKEGICRRIIGSEENPINHEGAAVQINGIFFVDDVQASFITGPEFGCYLYVGGSNT